MPLPFWSVEPITIRPPQVAQRSTPSRASSRSDFARRPRGERIRCTFCQVAASTIAGCESGFDELAEAELAEVHPRREHRLHAVEAALDPVLAQELADLADGRAAGAQLERVTRRPSPPSGAVRGARPRAAGSRAGCSANVGRPSAIARRFASCVRSAVTRRWYSDDRAQHRPREPLAGAAVRDLPDVDGEDRAAGPLDALDDLGLNRERADEPVEVGDDDDVRLASLDHLDGAAEAGALRERRTAGHVELLERVDQLEPVALAGRGDTLALLGGDTASSPSLLTRTMPTARRRRATMVDGRRTGT